MKNLGFTLDCHLTMNAHVTKIALSCYFELRRLASIRRFLTSTATATLVSEFVWSRIDYCNSLLFGSTHDVTSHLQRIQNYAARVILCLPKSSSAATTIRNLHVVSREEMQPLRCSLLTHILESGPTHPACAMGGDDPIFDDRSCSTRPATPASSP